MGHGELEKIVDKAIAEGREEALEIVDFKESGEDTDNDVDDEPDSTPSVKLDLEQARRLKSRCVHSLNFFEYHLR